jgi:hypothetical protein
LGYKNGHVLTHIFSVRLAAPFSKNQGCANDPFHRAAKNDVAEHNAMREGHLHDDMKSYGSETEALCPFSGKAAGHKHGSMRHRKMMWQDQHSAT